MAGAGCGLAPPGGRFSPSLLSPEAPVRQAKQGTVPDVNEAELREASSLRGAIWLVAGRRP